MGGGHAEILAELFVGDDVGHILRQALAHVVVDLAVGPVVAVQRRRNDQGEDHQEQGESLHHPGGQMPGVGNQSPVAGFLQGLVEDQNQAGQNRHAPDNSQQHALSHDDA